MCPGTTEMSYLRSAHSGRAKGTGGGVRFGDHVLDTERHELRLGAELVALEPQVFDLLVYLLCGGPLTSD